jgi:hypothetical protein
VRRNGPLTPKVQTEIVPYNEENHESYLMKLCAGGGHSKAVKSAKAKLIGISDNVIVPWSVRCSINSNMQIVQTCTQILTNCAPCANVLPAEIHPLLICYCNCEGASVWSD